MRGVKPRLGHLSSETTTRGRFTRQMAEPRLQPRIPSLRAGHPGFPW
jgi:hypothetical protein